MSNQPPPAARWEDLIAHNQSQLFRILGEAASGLAAGWAAAKFLRVVVALNPAGLAFFVASIFVEFAIGKLVDFAADKLGESIVSPGEMGIKFGSNNVSINRRPASRGGKKGDMVKCHEPHKIIEGSKWVAINEYPAARVDDWTNHSAKVATGSPNVFIGGPRVDADRKSELQEFVKFAFIARDLSKAYRKSWTEFGKEGVKKGGDKALDTAWDAAGGDKALDSIWDFITK